MDITKATKSTLIAAVLFAGVNAFASASNIDVVAEQTGRAVVVIKGQQLSRAEVKAQFLAAQAAGELIVGQNNETARELDPRLYPVDAAAANAPKISRAQVRSEFLTAQAAGELVTGENGETARALNPRAYHAQAKAAPAADTSMHAQRHAVPANGSYYGI